MSSTTDTPKDDLPVHLIIADVWHEGNDESVEVHLLLTNKDDENLVDLALSILAEEGYHEAELLEVGTIEDQPDEEPHRSAWETARGGEVALIEFDGDDDEDEE